MLFSRPYIVCRCGRVFLDGEDVWTHVRNEFEQERRAREAHDEMMKRLRCGACESLRRMEVRRPIPHEHTEACHTYELDPG